MLTRSPDGHAPLRETITRGDLTRATFSDLDLDGAGKALVSTEKSCGTSNCLYFLYLSRRGCPTFARSFYSDPARVTLLPSSHDGVQDVRVFGVDGCAGRAGRSDLLRWDGYRYAVVESVACDCPGTAAPSSRRPSVCPP